MLNKKVRVRCKTNKLEKEDSAQFFNIVHKLKDEDREHVIKMAEMLFMLQKKTAEAFHLSNQELNQIMNGTYEVDHVVYYRRGKKAAKRIALILILSILISVSGIADDVRKTLLRFFEGSNTANVAPITYEKTMGLSGHILPDIMPKGYNYISHTLSSDGTLVVLYEDDAGNSIKYFCYPKNAIASYDNEYTN